MRFTLEALDNPHPKFHKQNCAIEFLRDVLY